MASRFYTVIFATYSGIITSISSSSPYGLPSLYHGTLLYRVAKTQKPAKTQRKNFSAFAEFCVFATPVASVICLAPIIIGAKPLDQ